MPELYRVPENFIVNVRNGGAAELVPIQNIPKWDIGICRVRFGQLNVLPTMVKATSHPAYETVRLMLVEGRKRLRLTQAQVAEKLGRPQSYVSKYESGERRLDIVEVMQVAKVIKIDIGQLTKRLEDKLVVAPNENSNNGPKQR